MLLELEGDKTRECSVSLQHLRSHPDFLPSSQLIGMLNVNMTQGLPLEGSHLHSHVGQ